MGTSDSVKASKFLSLVLRHEPSRAGITLDEAGWADVGMLLEGCAREGIALSRDELTRLVETSDKKRFALSEDGTLIRANQGHSVDVELGFQPATPPPMRFHGTVAEVLHLIRADGLCKMSRHHVHMSVDEETARRVGSRRGRPVILRVDARMMHAAGHAFYVSANGVWLAEHVPASFIAFPEAER